MIEPIYNLVETDWKCSLFFLVQKTHLWLEASNRFRGTQSCSVMKESSNGDQSSGVCTEMSKTIKNNSKENLRSFSFFFFLTLSGVTLIHCLWLSPVKYSALNFSFFVQHPIKRADDPLLTKTFIKEVGFFISNPSWFQIDVRPSVRWAETGWQGLECDYGSCPLCVMSVGAS